MMIPRQIRDEKIPIKREEMDQVAPHEMGLGVTMYEDNQRTA